VTTIPHTTPRSASGNLARPQDGPHRRPGRPSMAWVESVWILDPEARQREEDRAIAAAYAAQRPAEAVA
jgi:hypothetical protein